ncbi:hypothetical protein [Streptomyces arenae]|uniref:hypothetical protein n=1 Tax=Streptomyces arenae TaxID=29301 RepID=UPI002658556E|nr:hypothetical protein [Streptomyces arenae]MCG7207428.1 hypothetical protein [Streptomyces arenae]
MTDLHCDLVDAVLLKVPLRRAHRFTCIELPGRLVIPVRARQGVIGLEERIAQADTRQGRKLADSFGIHRPIQRPSNLVVRL